MRILVFLFTVLYTVNSGAKVFLTAGLPAFPPFAFEETDETHVGSVVRYFELLSQQLGLEIKVQRLPYARMKKSLENGSLDMAVIFRNEQLSRSVEYVGRVSFEKVLILPRKNIQLEQYEQLLLLGDIGVIRGASFNSRFDKDASINKYFVNDYVQGLSMLRLGRVDAVVGSLAGLGYTISLLNQKASDFGDPLFMDDKEWWLHFSKKSKHLNLASEVASGIEALYEPYLIYELYDGKPDNGIGN